MVYKNISHFAVMLKLIMIDKVQYFFYFLHFFVVQLLTKFLRAHNIILHKISYNVKILLFRVLELKSCLRYWIRRIQLIYILYHLNPKALYV